MTLSHAVAGVPRTARTRHGRAGVAEREGAAIADVIPLERRSVTPVELPDASRATTSPAATRTPVVEARPVGAHREPGSNPWRTGLREILAFVTLGRWVVFAHRPAPAA